MRGWWCELSEIAITWIMIGAVLAALTVGLVVAVICG